MQQAGTMRGLQPRSTRPACSALTAVRKSRQSHSGKQLAGGCYQRQLCCTTDYQLGTRRHTSCRSSTPDAEVTTEAAPLVGEDAAVFDASQQSLKSWTYFFIVLGVVMAILYVVWIAPGLGLADDYVAAFESFSSDSSVVMAAILVVFALFHSGLAFLRPYGEQVMGNRAYRVLFASISLPLATVALFYFINHRYDGVPLWNVRGVPGVHTLVWIMNFVSFYFLYPSTFNLLEVAAVDKPKLHMWETGVMRITRHPQMVGQFIWCLGHTLWIGSSFMCVTTAMLMAHHLFAVWHGDFRLKRQYGEAFEEVKARTSVIPFQAVWEGRQKLPADYYKEWLRLPYITITIFTLGAYFAHPIMQRTAYWLNW